MAYERVVTVRKARVMQLIQSQSIQNMILVDGIYALCSMRLI